MTVVVTEIINLRELLFSPLRKFKQYIKYQAINQGLNKGQWHIQIIMLNTRFGEFDHDFILLA